MRRVVILAALSAGLLAFTLIPAHAVTELKACTGAGALQVTPGGGGTTSWSLSGSGFCDDVFPSKPLQTMSATGSGTSTGLGLCGQTLIVQNLKLNVSVSLRDVVTGAVQTFNEVWSAPVTTFPLVSPFLVSGPGSGAGVIFTHIFLQCPPAGQPALQFDWAQTLS